MFVVHVVPNGTDIQLPSNGVSPTKVGLPAAGGLSCAVTIKQLAIISKHPSKAESERAMVSIYMEQIRVY